VTVTQATIKTERGDTVMVTLFDGADPSIILSVDDVDDAEMPSVELTISEAAELREALRFQLEEAAGPRGAWRWTRRR
jgi:hypothetical protein